MSHLINVEAMERAASRMECAAAEATRAADRMDDAVHRLNLLLADGYGNNACRLIELLTNLDATTAASTARTAPDGA